MVQYCIASKVQHKLWSKEDSVKGSQWHGIISCVARNNLFILFIYSKHLKGPVRALHKGGREHEQSYNVNER